MSDELLTQQFERLLDTLPEQDPWPTLAASGFLDLLRPESEGGAGLGLEALFPLALAVGRRRQSPPILETMAARLLAPGALAVSDIEEALGSRPLAAVIAAGQMAGAMEQVQALTVEYVSTRRQFGREIGKFQAVQQQVAVLAQEVMVARIAAEAAFSGAAMTVSEQRAGVAKLRAGQSARVVCAIGHALHGAIGVSEEHPLHLYTRRLRRWSLAHGGESWWAARLGHWAFSSDQTLLELARAI